jgi:hypothetical protein
VTGAPLDGLYELSADAESPLGWAVLSPFQIMRLPQVSGEGGGEPTRDGPLPRVQLSMLLQEESVNIDQRDRITSASGAALAVLGRPGSLSTALGRQLPKDTDATGGTGSRPCLTVLPGGAQSDVELMRRFRTGDWGGFEALYCRYISTAYLICRRTLTCSETALDSANDTFLTMLANSDHLDPHRLDDWLMGTAHYLAERRAHQGLQPKNGARLHLVSCYARHDSHHDRGAGEQP